MNKVTTEIIRDFLEHNRVELHSTQGQICVPIINRLYKKMRAGIRFQEIEVDEDWICDGHHRYLAALLAGYPLGRRPYAKTSATQRVDWNSVIFLEDDYDTSQKIQFLNTLDAEFNQLTVAEIEEILK